MRNTLQNTFVISVFALSAGCGTLRMKPPLPAAQAALWSVEGHTPGSNGRDRHLRVDAYDVLRVEGTPIAPAGLAAYGRVADQRSWDYRFDLTGRGRTLHAECTEAVDHARWYGFGEILLNLTCSCTEGSVARVSLALADEKGTLDLGGGVVYPLAAAYESEQGKTAHDILGYRLGKKEVLGAVDVTTQARAFVPNGLSEDHQAALACAYAALLLHRANK